MQKNKSKIIKVSSSLKIDFARTCLCLILKLDLLFLQTGTCAYMNNGTDEIKILPGMHGNSLSLYQLSLNAWELHDSKFYSVHVLKFPDSRQNSRFCSFNGCLGNSVAHKHRKGDEGDSVLFPQSINGSVF